MVNGISRSTAAVYFHQALIWCLFLHLQRKHIMKCFKITCLLQKKHHSNNLEVIKLVVDAITAFPSTMCTSWCTRHQFLPCVLHEQVHTHKTQGSAILSNMLNSYTHEKCISSVLRLLYVITVLKIIKSHDQATLHLVDLIISMDPSH